MGADSREVAASTSTSSRHENLENPNHAPMRLNRTCGEGDAFTAVGAVGEMQRGPTLCAPGLERTDWLADYLTNSISSISTSIAIGDQNRKPMCGTGSFWLKPTKSEIGTVTACQPHRSCTT